MLIPEDRERARINIQKVLEGAKMAGNEYTALKRDGSTFPIEIHSARIMYDGKATGIRGVIMDMAEKRSLEEEKKKLENHLSQIKRIKALGTLAAGIAHNFNNLLMGIQGNVSLMQMETDTNHPNYERLNRIQKQVFSGEGGDPG